MDEKSARKLWLVMGTPQTTNIISIITFLSTTIIGIITISISNNVEEYTKSPINVCAIVLYIILIITTFLNIVFLYRSKKNLEKYNIIKILCELQNKYILNADFKTSKQHGDLSKEKHLTINGEARILTNSLNYDIFYCNSIADNIIAGAKYTYVIPCSFQVITELQSYIVELYNKLYEILLKQNKNNHAIATTKVKRILEENVEFCFFDEEILCLYNFARFNQVGNPHFIQSWWYVNPKDNNIDSYMISREIVDESDQKRLNEAFDQLNSISKNETGCSIYEERSQLLSRFGGH